MSSDIVEIRQLTYPILEVDSNGVALTKNSRHFDVVAREYYEYGEGDNNIIFDSAGYRYTIIATRIYNLSSFDRFWGRLGDFYLNDNWKTGVRCEIDCKTVEQLSFDEFCTTMMDILLQNKSWWYDLTEDDIRTIFDGCKTIKDAMKAVNIVGWAPSKTPKVKSNIFQDLTVLQKMK